uniref:G-protein coupled receptors family 3 profile domain-containing protein n=1 Tax=Pyxicephalus adspersus TaxID=30357 RepID=A0AAV3ASP4_PYXAD|nr:TPA: hypothetical protein GDO54_009766 [Pyxicephalus adspersus]
MYPLFEYEYYQRGDVIIGGLFSVYTSTNMLPMLDGVCTLPYVCSQLDRAEYEFLMAFFFAIVEINKDPNLLPNITVGYHLFDTCGYHIKAINSVLKILTGYKGSVPNYSCMEGTQVPGFVGDATFVPTIAVAELLNIYQYTQISHRVTDPFLNDREKFPNFYRTIPSSWVWYEIVIKFLKKFRWNWVGIITSSDGTGETELRKLRKEMTRHGICIEFVIYLTDNEDINRKKALIIEKSTTDVVIVCGHFVYQYIALFEESKVLRQNKTLILNQSWNVMGSPVISLKQTCNCSIIAMHPPNNIPGLDAYMYNAHPSKRPTDPLLEDIWLAMFNCASSNEYKTDLFRSYNFVPNVTCTGTEPLVYHFSNKYDPRFYFIYTAVYALADALHSLDPFVFYYKHSSILEASTIEDIPVKLFWKQDKIPQARCNDPCLPGSRKVSTGEIHVCCYRCVICSEGEVSNVIVKANNQNVSFILLTSILLSFLCVFLFLGRPVDITCMLRQILYGIFFSIAVSSVLAKTITVCIAFKASKPGSVWRKWVGEKISNSVVLITSFVQVLICVIWLSVSPPYQEYDLHFSPGKIVIQCNEGSVIGFYSMLGYMGFLAAVSFVLAFMVRTLPDSFNEAKYITFSMLVFCSVWIAMIPAYLSTRGKYMVAVEIFAILASSAGLLGCIFFPKCYIIIIKPERNTRKFILNKIRL